MHGRMLIRFSVLALLLVAGYPMATGGGMAPLLGGSISWEVDGSFGSGTRRVALRMSSAFVRDSQCQYTVGDSISCEYSGCGGGGSSGACSIAEVHGVLCVAQLIPDGNGGFSIKYTGGNSSQCLHDANLPSAVVHGGGLAPGGNMVGKANAFTVSSIHGGGVDKAMFGRNLTGTDVVVGSLTHEIVVDGEAEGLLAWLAPRTGFANLQSAHGLLPPQCPGIGSAVCSINVETPLGGSSGLFRSSGAGPPGAPGILSESDLYWANFSLPTEDWRNAAPALETFVPLCSSTGSAVAGARSCSSVGIENFFSPRAPFPLVVEVPVTPRDALQLGASFQGAGSLFSAPHSSLHLKTYDNDG